MVRKKSSSEVPQFTFDKHHHTARIDPARTYQTTFAAQHALVHLLVSPLVFAAPHQRMYLAEVEFRKVARRADRRAGAAADAGLQLGHLAQYLVALAQVVAVDVDRPRLGDGISEIDRCHMLNPYIPGRSIGGGRPFVQALSDILRRRDRPGIENTLDIALHVAEEHVARRHEAARRTVQPGPLGKSGVVVVGTHAHDQDQHVDAHAQRTSREGILGLDLYASVDHRARLRNTPADEMNVVFLLCLAVHLLVTGAEHADIHVKIEHVGLGKHLPHLHGLLHPRDAAYLRAMLLANLLVARAHAVQEGDAPGARAVGPGHAAFVEHPLDVDRRKDVVVDAVAVFLLDRGKDRRYITLKFIRQQQMQSQRHILQHRIQRQPL